jgi:single-strand DNA-binding protein
MASVNKVIIVGNLGRDPEVRTFPSGDRVANVTIATTDKWKDKTSGEMKEATEWHRVVFNGRLAEIAGEYLRKGSQVYVEGSIRTRKYTDKDGNERQITEVRADTMQMLGSRQGMGAPSSQDDDDGASRRASPPSRSQPVSKPAAAKPSTGFDDMDDDIPF